MCSKERECTRKRANSDGCYLFEYETGIAFLPSQIRPSTHLRRREHQQPHVQLEDFKKKEQFPCPKCDRVLPSKQGLSNHLRTAHKSDNPKELRTRSAGSAAAPLTHRRQILVNLDESSGPDDVFAEAHPMQPVAADGTPTLPGGIPRNSQAQIDVVRKSTSARGKKKSVNAEGEADKAIVAKNKAGPGQPSDPSDMIMLPSTSDAPRRSRRIVANVRCADEPLLAKAPFNVPGRPYPPEPLYTTDNSIMLKWERPSLDRGTPITDYELEIRERGTKLWEKATTTNAALWEKEAFGNVPDTRIKVTSVKRQQIYEFRVAAVNAAGRGEWSKNSVPIAATWFPCKPLITMGPLACDMTVLVGEQAKLLVPYAANSSRPKFVWSKNGEAMDPRDDPRVKEEKSDTLIQLCYPKCEQSDTGTYSIRIVNDLGSDSVDLRLKVVDRPAPPEGSLKERTASSSGRRRVGSTAADRSAQAAAAACAAGEEATDEVDNNEEERQNMAVMTKRMANLDLETSGTPARIVEIPENVTVVEGELAIIKCVVEGNPAPTIVWKKGGRKMPLTDDRVRCQTDGDTGHVSLIISKCRPQDGGEYTLMVKNAHGKHKVGAKLLVTPAAESNLDIRAKQKKRGTGISNSEQEKQRQRSDAEPKSKAERRKCQVYVVEEPRDTFVVPLNSQHANEKENATFECEVNDKEIDVKWFHDGAEIGMDGRHFKERAGCRRRLLIINVLIEDHGEYKCTAKDDETMAQLIVHPKFVKKSGAQAGDLLVGR